MSIDKKFLLVCLVSVASTGAFGQAASSPINTFGIGEHYGNALIHNQGMAGVGIAAPQYWYSNNLNPALLVYNSTTIFSTGILYESRFIKGDTVNEKSTGGNLNYLTMVFPIRPKDVTKPLRWTTSIGIQPFTKVKYKLIYNEPVVGATVGTAEVSQKGSGGLTQFFWSNGYRIKKGFSVGLRASYIFGSFTNQYSNTLLGVPQPAYYTVSVSEKNSVSDFNFEAGFAYVKDSVLNGKYRFTVGGTYGFNSNLNTRRKIIFSRLDATNPDKVLDSVTLRQNKGEISIPQDIGIGVSLAKGQYWLIGMDFKHQDWTTFRSVDAEDAEGLTKSWKASIGGEFTPDPYSVDNFVKRMTYRAGASFEKTPYLINNNPVNDFGINFGLSVPTGRSSLDLAFRVGKRGNKSENVLEENYFKVYFGLTLNDQWFVKRKFD